MLPSKFGVNWLFGSRDEVKNRFSRWRPWQPSWISDRNDFSYFQSTSHPASYQVLSQLAFGVGEEGQNRFSRWPPWQPSWIYDRHYFSFDLQVTPMPPTKFRVNWPFSAGEEAKNRLSRWQPWQPSWISDRNDFSYLWSTSHPDASYQVSSQLTFGFRRKEK